VVEGLELADEGRAHIKALVLTVVSAEIADIACGQAGASKRHNVR
jgi:hypothetical protein